ncbi:MAG: hypothetical protein ACXW4M_15380 [Anaerolineales bacterium]
MYTKPLVQQSIVSMDLSNELSTLRRLFVAAAISSQFCDALLGDPGATVRRGFGGEHFLLSESTMKTLISVRATTLPEFIHRLDDKLSNSLLGVENFKAYR